MLPSDYYLANFNHLVDFVESTYRELLDDEERAWLQRLRELPKPAQQLYVRLLGRKASLFRISRLSYPEIESIPIAADHLVAVGLGCDDPGDDLSTILRSFTKPELINRLELDDVSKLSRVELTDRIESADPATRLRYVNRLESSDSWIGISGHRHFALFSLCFFGNLSQDISEFVRRDLGTLRYEGYVINERQRPFKSRRQLESHLRYYECDAISRSIDFDDKSALLKLANQIPQRCPKDHHLDRRIDRIRNRIARQLERLGDCREALTLYKESLNPPGRERAARLLYKLEEHAHVRDVLAKIIAEPRGEAELQFAQQFSVKTGVLRSKRVKPFKPQITKLALNQSEARVEIAAKEFFSQFGDCYFVENNLVDGVLGLFIWDIVFANVPGAFFNPFQSAPSDLYHQEFVEKRQVLLDKRMQELEDPVLFATRVRKKYESRYGIANPLVRWHKLPEQLLSKALFRIPVEHWKSLFERLLMDLRENSSGLPDLVLFPADGSYELIEIKGPGDAIQKNQRRWMRYFSEHDIPCRVVNVRWIQATVLQDSINLETDG